MAELSIIEFVVYGLIGYFGIIILMISILLNPPTSISLAGVRSIWLMPSVLSIAMLMFLSGIVVGEDQTTESITYNSTGTQIENTVITQSSSFQLVNPVWASFHLGLFLILIVYILVQVVNILRAKD